MQAFQFSSALTSRFAHTKRRELHVSYWYPFPTSKFSQYQMRKDKRVGSNKNNLSVQNKDLRKYRTYLEDPSRPSLHRCFFSFKLTLHLGFFFTWMRENGIQSAELNWFAAALTQTPEIPITYPIVPRAWRKQTFTLIFVNGFYSQVL